MIIFKRKYFINYWFQFFNLPSIFCVFFSFSINRSVMVMCNVSSLVYLCQNHSLTYSHWPFSVHGWRCGGARERWDEHATNQNRTTFVCWKYNCRILIYYINILHNDHSVYGVDSSADSEMMIIVFMIRCQCEWVYLNHNKSKTLVLHMK